MTSDASRPRAGTPGADGTSDHSDAAQTTATDQLRTTPHRVGQGDLFGTVPVVPVVLPLAVRERDPETSVRAAERARRRAHRSRLRGDILHQHQLHPDGLTDDELYLLLEDDDRGVVARRRLDLVREGLAEDSGLRRPTRTGSPAIVWRLVR